MFKTTKKHLGTVKSGSKLNVEFPYEDIGTVYAINLSCGCSTAYNDPNKQMIMVQYTAQPVPEHLKNQFQHQYTTEKFVDVVHTPLGENTSISTRLSFEVTVKD